MLRIDIWSDIVCPWCYIGKRRLESALATFPHAAEVELVYYSFELDPTAPRTREDGGSYAERLSKKYRVPLAQAEEMIARTATTAKAEGLDFHYDTMKSGNTFDAHRLLHFGKERGVQVALKERLMRGYFTEGVAIGEVEPLVALAADVGLPEAEAREVLLDRTRFAEQVRADEALAGKLGISGVPFFVLGGRLAISGAQPAEFMKSALEKAWADFGSASVQDQSEYRE